MVMKKKKKEKKKKRGKAEAGVMPFDNICNDSQSQQQQQHATSPFLSRLASPRFE